MNDFSRAIGNFPLGVSVENEVTSVAVWSQTADAIWLNILSENGQDTVARFNLEKRHDGIWFSEIPGMGKGTCYTLGASGPTGPRHAFDSERQLLDPYARGLVRRSPSDYHCVVIDDEFDWQGITKPRTAMSESVVYEAHLRGLTRLNPDIPSEIRGSYAALGHPATIDYLVGLGITAIELLPIHAIISEPRIINLGLINYWGYNTINFFSPHMRYAAEATRASGPQAILTELKTAIRELHRAGIEVILDVVFNHTAEGGANGLSYSYRGLDNSTYYRQDDAGNYIDTTGCGNSLDFSQPIVQRLVMDSLRYWSNEVQIDGFRFDLATTLARDENNHFQPEHRMLSQISEDPMINDAKLIVEPWDVGLNGWQTGNFPGSFAEWNDRYRDSIRKFWLTDISLARNSGQPQLSSAEFAGRLAGSQDFFGAKDSPAKSVNFVTAHDGFTLADLVCYNQKINSANGESNRDGSSNNHSFDHGVDGPTDNPFIQATRRRAMRNLMASLLFSAGTPMLTAGDERMKSQQGNNNAYCQDNATSWLSWESESQQQDFKDTVCFLIGLRRQHASLRPNGFARAWADQEALQEGYWLSWHSQSGAEMQELEWSEPQSRCFQRFAVNIAGDGLRNFTCLLVNGIEQTREFVLPNKGPGTFELLWDSAMELPPTRAQFLEPGAQLKLTETSMQLWRWQPED